MKKILLTILTLMLLIPFAINAEELKLDWQKTWGGSSGDEFYDILQTQDEEFVIAGYTKSTDVEGVLNNGRIDALIIKYDKVGNLVWQKSWGGNNNDYFYDILQTQDGGFIGTGYSESTDIEEITNKGRSDAIIVKYDKDGNMLWQKNWGGNSYDYFYDMIQTQDEGIIGVGFSYSSNIEGISNNGASDAVIVKYDKEGNLLWQKNWGGEDTDEFYDVLLTQDGGFIVAGYSASTDIEGLQINGYDDAVIVKYDKEGNMLWQKSWGGEDADYFNHMFQTQDGGFIVTADSDSTDIEGIENKGYEDAIIIKYDKDGNMLWQKSWGGNDTDYFNNIVQTKDGGFIGLGYSDSTNVDGFQNKGNSDAIIVKYDKDGNMLWQKSLGGNYDEEFYGIVQTQDGGFVGIGYSESTNIEGLINKGSSDAIIVKCSFEYDYEVLEVENGTSVIEQQGPKGIITTNPNTGYEVDKILIKDKEGNILDVEITKLENETYSFDLYTDVSVKVIYKEKIENPKTGIIDFVSILFTGIIISLGGFVLVKRSNERYEI